MNDDNAKPKASDWPTVRKATPAPAFEDGKPESPIKRKKSPPDNRTECDKVPREPLSSAT